MASTLQGNKSIERCIKVMEAFTFERRHLSIADLQRATGMPRASLYRILNPLVEASFLHYDALDGNYRIGLKLFELGHIAQSGFHLSSLLPRFMNRLAAQLPYTLLVGLLDEGKLVYIDKRENPEGLKVGSQVGRVRDPHYGLLGKLLLSFLPDEETWSLLETNPPRMWEGRSTFTTGNIRRSIEIIRAQGYAVAIDETAPGISGVAVPLFGHRDDRAVAGLLVLVPTVSFTDDVRELCLLLARDFSREISRLMGSRKYV